MSCTSSYFWPSPGDSVAWDILEKSKVFKDMGRNLLTRTLLCEYEDWKENQF